MDQYIFLKQVFLEEVKKFLIKIQYSINHAAPHFLAILKIGAFELPLTRNEDLGEIGPSLTLCVELGRNGPGGIYHLGPHSLNE